MDLDDIASAQESIRRIYPSARFPSRTLLGHSAPPDAILTAPEDIDLYIILGSARSNNTLKLEAVAKKAYPKVPGAPGLGFGRISNRTILRAKRKPPLRAALRLRRRYFPRLKPI
jgi:hypothetical protein